MPRQPSEEFVECWSRNWLQLKYGPECKFKISVREEIRWTVIVLTLDTLFTRNIYNFSKKHWTLDFTEIVAYVYELYLLLVLLLVNHSDYDYVKGRIKAVTTFENVQKDLYKEKFRYSLCSLDFLNICKMTFLKEIKIWIALSKHQSCFNMDWNFIKCMDFWVGKVYIIIKGKTSAA